ncbi:MAG: hypothetical protein MZW92_02640 [Comamonadaceae bacterium]|nr:hypothetical protein [Comamonadaceae bacterium]
MVILMQWWIDASPRLGRSRPVSPPRPISSTADSSGSAPATPAALVNQDSPFFKASWEWYKAVARDTVKIRGYDGTPPRRLLHRRRRRPIPAGPRSSIHGYKSVSSDLAILAQPLQRRSASASCFPTPAPTACPAASSPRSAISNNTTSSAGSTMSTAPTGRPRRSSSTASRWALRRLS